MACAWWPTAQNFIPVAGKYILKCLLSPDVRQLATASADKTVKLWNLDGFTLERTLTGQPLFVYPDSAHNVISLPNISL